MFHLALKGRAAGSALEGVRAGPSVGGFPLHRSPTTRERPVPGKSLYLPGLRRSPPPESVPGLPSCSQAPAHHSSHLWRKGALRPRQAAGSGGVQRDLMPGFYLQTEERLKKRGTPSGLERPSKSQPGVQAEEDPDTEFHPFTLEALPCRPCTWKSPHLFNYLSLSLSTCLLCLCKAL